MPTELLHSWNLLGWSGQLLLVVIVSCFLGALVCHGIVRTRYATITRDLRSHGQSQLFQQDVLSAALEEAQSEVQRRGRLVDAQEINVQSVVEQVFHRELAGTLMAERFVRAVGSLVIVLGLLGTLLGLTQAVGRLVSLVVGEAGAASGAGLSFAEALTRGLRDTLGGMALAFSTSLAGVFAAAVLTVVGVVVNLPDRRALLLSEIETYLERVIALAPGVSSAGSAGGAQVMGVDRLEQAVDTFRGAVRDLQSAVVQFEVALQTFAGGTRDFKEINLHLKDNIQRMSLSFADFSDGLRTRLERLR